MTDDTPAMVGIVVVSHSAEVAEATVRLVARLANLPADGPRLLAAGGLEDGSIGTDAPGAAQAPGGSGSARRGGVRNGR